MSTIVFMSSSTTTSIEPSPSSSNIIVNTPSVSVSSEDISFVSSSQTISPSVIITQTFTNTLVSMSDSK